MKIITTIIGIFTFLHVYGQEYYFINAENGLNVRSQGNLSSNKVAKIPFGVLVEKISETDKVISLKDNGKLITGRFVKIKYNNYLYLVNEEIEQFEREGYVFDGYLKKQKNSDIVSTSKIEKDKYIELLNIASKENNKSKKIGNLDSIKTILKGRVDWFTEVNEYGYQREDAIKSITTNNGQKLIISQIGNDYGFVEGWSGYYPEYDILVLEGGHSSDMCFSIKTGETDLTIGNPEYIVSSPKNSYRLNGYFGGQECVSYFFQKNENGKFIYLTEFNWDYDICTFKEFYWIDETDFIYKKMNLENGVEEYFKGEIKVIQDKI